MPLAPKSRLICSLILILFPQISVCESYNAEKFSVEFPQNFMVVSTPPAIFSVTPQSESSRFPTGNIIEELFPYPFDRARHLQRQELLSSYREVGLNSAEVLEMELHNEGDRGIASARLAFTRQNMQYVAHIAIVSTRTKHFIFTVIASPNGDEKEAQGLLNTLSRTFQLRPEESFVMVPVETNSAFYPSLVTILILGLFFGLGVWFLATRTARLRFRE